MSTLSEEIARRLRNTSLRLDSTQRLEILEKACTKMRTSGHTEEFIRLAVEQGIRAFDDKVKRSCLNEDHPSFQPLFPKAGWRRNLKTKEKAQKRSNWSQVEIEIRMSHGEACLAQGLVGGSSRRRKYSRRLEGKKSSNRQQQQ